MVKLPASLERQLQKLFPRARDRDKFVADVLERALLNSDTTLTEPEAPEFIGGTIHLFSDGGSRGNPGQAAIGCVLENPDTGEVMKEYMDRIGIATNNIAEYKALIKGLEIAKRYRPNHLVCHLDSELVVRQLNGEYRVKMPTLQPLVDTIKELTTDFKDVKFVHIPRDDNHRADALVNSALDTLPDPPYEPTT